ncbi:MAG: hypothetical protein V7765_04235 [Oleispira sp.]
MKIWHSPLLASAIIALTACGGSSSGSSNKDNNDDAAPVNPGGSITYGRVIDGYLENALVCIDSNNDSQCSSNESPVKTDAQGRFNLAGLENKALIAQAVAGVTKDADDNGDTITHGFTLSASADQSGIITPFTTLLIALEKSGLSKADALAELSSSLDIPADTLNQDYINLGNSAMAKVAQILVDTIQAITAKALQESDNSADDQLTIEALAWSQLTPAALIKLTELRSQDSDALPSALVSQWITAIPELAITKEEISGSEPVDPDPVDPDPTDPDPVDPDPTDPDPVDPDPTPNNQFSKISAAGLELVADASDYACVTQNINAAGQTIPSADRNTWMLLIPTDATYADVGFTPGGYTATDRFWDYEHIIDGEITSFYEANGITSRHSNDNQLETLVTVLNANNYCGFSDWSIPSISQLQELNTKPLTSEPATKTLDRSIFKNFAVFETQTSNRLDSSGNPIDPMYYPDLVQPYFWSSTRTLDNNGNAENGIYDFQAYLHATETDTDEKTNDAYSSAYYALRAVRHNRFQRIANDSSNVDLSASDWSCVKDNDTSGRRYWSNPIGELSNVEFDDIDAKITAFNNANSCGFADWRLPTKKELITLKPLIGNTYFNVGKPRSYISYNWVIGDYVWIKPVVDDEENVMYSWQLSDDGLTHGKYSSIANANLFLIRDDVFSANAFDEFILLVTEKLNHINTLETGYSAINIDTSASDASSLKAAFQQLNNLPTLIKNRDNELKIVIADLGSAQTKLTALIQVDQTALRKTALSQVKAEQQRLSAQLITDAESLKTILDALLIQFDAWKTSANSDEEKAEVLTQGIFASTSIATIYQQLGLKLSDKLLIINTTISERKTEASSLPAVTLNGGYRKIAKNGTVSDIFQFYGDNWRCVQKVEIDGDFTTNTSWTILDSEDLANSHTKAKQRLATINTDSLCGINTWQLPTENLLNTLKTVVITTDSGTDTQTIDDLVFVNHKEAIKTAAYYWTNEGGDYRPDVLRFAQQENEEGSEDRYGSSSSSGNSVNDVNSRFHHKITTYSSSDTSCGNTKVRYKNNCYQVFTTELNWADANQSCVNSSSALLAKDDLQNSDHEKLAIALSFTAGTSLWITEDPRYTDYAFTIDDDNGHWQLNTSSKGKTNLKPYLCVSILPENNPAAPSTGLVNDDDNTFSWTWSVGYDNASDYFYTTDAGSTWQQATANPQSVGNADYASEAVQVRVQASRDFNTVSLPLLSDSAFTLSANSNCSGGDKAAEVNGTCYTRHDSEKNWEDAKASCALIPSRLNDTNILESTFLIALSNALELESSTGYWLENKGEWLASPDSLLGQSVTSAISGNAAQPYICIQ